MGGMLTKMLNNSKIFLSFFLSFFLSYNHFLRKKAGKSSYEFFRLLIHPRKGEYWSLPLAGFKTICIINDWSFLQKHLYCKWWPQLGLIIRD
jgi:hypothetical protein